MHLVFRVDQLSDVILSLPLNTNRKDTRAFPLCNDVAFSLQASTYYTVTLTYATNKIPQTVLHTFY
jgi:hypothetical protein